MHESQVSLTPSGAFKRSIRHSPFYQSQMLKQGGRIKAKKNLIETKAQLFFGEEVLGKSSTFHKKATMNDLESLSKDMVHSGSVPKEEGSILDTSMTVKEERGKKNSVEQSFGGRQFSYIPDAANFDDDELVHHHGGSCEVEVNEEPSNSGSNVGDLNTNGSNSQSLENEKE